MESPECHGQVFPDHVTFVWLTSPVYPVTFVLLLVASEENASENPSILIGFLDIMIHYDCAWLRQYRFQRVNELQIEDLAPMLSKLRTAFSIFNP